MKSLHWSSSIHILQYKLDDLDELIYVKLYN